MKNANGLLTIKNLVKHFDISGGLLDQLSIEQKRIVRRRTTVKALNDVSLWINPRETLGVVGESGCGKSTLARTVLGLYPPNSGEIYYKDKRIDNLNPQRMLPYRKKMQMIFQDPKPWRSRSPSILDPSHPGRFRTRWPRLCNR
jgi:peptide/nickel transport system ATP-binding protein